MTTLEQAISIIDNIDFEKIENGKYVIADDFYYNVFEYEPKLENEIEYEAHQEYIDIQVIVKGVDKLMVTDVNALEESVAYDKEKDVAFFKNSNNKSFTLLRPGSMVILYPKDAHKSVRVQPGVIKKIVGKVKIQK